MKHHSNKFRKGHVAFTQVVFILLGLGEAEKVKVYASDDCGCPLQYPLRQLDRRPSTSLKWLKNNFNKKENGSHFPPLLQLLQVKKSFMSDYRKSGECHVDPFEHFKVILNPDETLTRVCQFPIAPATGEDDLAPGQRVVTKDVILNTDRETWIRIYRPAKLPSNDNNIAKLPIIIYFHAGGLILYHVDTVFNNEPCGRFSSEIPCILISVEYRLAPENRLPAAYEDGEDSIQWLKKQALDPNGDPWLKDFADFSRCYLMGCSSGANIVYNTILSIAEMDLGPLKINGIILNQPLFGGVKRTRTELQLANDSVMPLSALDLIWELSLPKGCNRDHEYANPMVEGKYTKNIRLLPKVLVRGFVGDPLLDRQRELVGMLIKNGVQVTAHFGEFGFHCIDFVEPKRHLNMITYMRDFI